MQYLPQILALLIPCLQDPSSWIDQLASDLPEIREAAERKLAGCDVRLLRSAHASTEDPETRARLSKVLGESDAYAALLAGEFLSGDERARVELAAIPVKALQHLKGRLPESRRAADFLRTLYPREMVGDLLVRFTLETDVIEEHEPVRLTASVLNLGTGPRDVAKLLPDVKVETWRGSRAMFLEAPSAGTPLAAGAERVETARLELIGGPGKRIITAPRSLLAGRSLEVEVVRGGDHLASKIDRLVADLVADERPLHRVTEDLRDLGSPSVDGVGLHATHPDPRVRVNILNVLATFDGARPYLDRALTDPDRDVRDSAKQLMELLDLP